MKVMALDLGNAWTGTALSDPLRMFSKPYKTAATENLEEFLKKTFSEEKITKIIVGYPRTMKGNESEQTKIVLAMKDKLALLFPSIEWILWDERLSSKQARKIKTPKNKEEKLQLHSIAAAIILESYLQFQNQSIY